MLSYIFLNIKRKSRHLIEDILSCRYNNSKLYILLKYDWNAKNKNQERLEKSEITISSQDKKKKIEINKNETRYSEIKHLVDNFIIALLLTKSLLLPAFQW